MVIYVVVTDDLRCELVLAMYIGTYIRILLYISLCICTYVRTCVCTYVRMCSHRDVRTYIRTYIRIYVCD